MAQDRVGGKAVPAAHATPPGARYLRTTLVQLAVIAVGAPTVYLLAGVPSTIALLCGAACAVVPQAYFALRMASSGKVSANKAARQVMVAEAGKFFLSVASFAAVFALVELEEPALVFVGFAVLWATQTIAAARLLRG